jgi:exopolysaccharide biosynthesis operon protein EpsL
MHCTSASRALPIPTLVGVLLSCLAPAARSQETPDYDAFVFFLSEQIGYDDNLFRLSDSELANHEQVLVQDTEDTINRLSAGMRAQVNVGRQDFSLNARINDLRFANNDQLDYTGGSGNFAWDWQAGTMLDGRAAAEYQRALASYTNYRYFGRDVVETLAGSGEARFKLGPRFALLGAVRSTQTEHSDVARQLEDFDSDSGRAGIEYLLPTGDRFVVEYRYLEGRFPNNNPLAPEPLARDYDEDLINFRMEYEITSKLQFKGNLGHLEREYPHGSRNGFSGETWRGTFLWQPRSKLGFDVSAWHELKAYVDSESEYFVADGFGLTPSWAPVDKVELQLALSYEDQDYIGTGALLTDAARRDKEKSAKFSATYKPRSFLELNLLYAYQERSSNRELVEYDVQTAGAEIRFVF